MTVAGLFILLLIGITTAVGYVVGVYALGLHTAALRFAWRQALECIGVGTVFMIVNVALGFLIVMAFRAAGAPFVSLYLVADPTVAMLSGLQAIVFQAWLARRDPAPSKETVR